MTQVNDRITRFTFGTIICFCIIVLRLIYLQISMSSYFSAKSEQNFTRLEKTQSPRGNILDAHHKLLATNRPITHLYWHGSGNQTLSTEQRHLLGKLAGITNCIDRENKTVMNTISQAERYHKQILLAADLSLDQLSKIEELFPNHPNILLKTHFERYYPYQTHASHILGYLGRQAQVEAMGKMGLEKLAEHMLKGTEGTVLRTINSFGRNIAQTKIKEELAGSDIQTTLDIELQKICEKVFPGEYAGSIILMNPVDGSLLAVVSRPNFDPSVFLNPITFQAWQDLQQNNPFLDRAFNASYPPGSIFKLVTISAALEQGIIEKNSMWHCKGFVTYGKRKYWCANRYGHGNLTTRQSVAQSCNNIFYEVGKKIDVDVIAQYADKFGLGKKTCSLFPEQTGLVPTRRWKMESKGEQWWQGETLSVSIGQSFLLATPIQVARMITSIFTGYLVTPRILATEPIQLEPLDIHPETLRFLQKSMRAVVTKGTGRRVKNLKDFKIYAKTSTAQTSTFSKRNLGQEYMEHGWFVIYFQYKDHIPLTLVMVVEHAGTSRVPALIARNFLLEYRKYMNKTV